MNEDKASRYHRLKRWASAVSLAWSVVLLTGLLASGLSVTLRSVAERSAASVTGSGIATSSIWAAGATVVVYVCLLTLVHEVGAAPIAFYGGFLLERRYGLSTERLAAWSRDHVKALLLGLLMAVVGAVAVYACIRVSPQRWWLGAGLLFAVVILGITQLAPILLLPIFYRLKPLERDALKARLLVLADRAGARVLGAYEWTLSDKTRKANAALTGLGVTRRILVSDTMLAEYSDDEIEVVLAHELAHHVHGDIWKGMLFEVALILAGFYLASLALLALTGPVGLRGVDDVAGLPLLCWRQARSPWWRFRRRMRCRARTSEAPIASL